MPYISRKRKDEMMNDTENAGELNYLFTVIAHDYIKRKGLKYQTLNEVIGVLECCKQELYRQIAAPYEDKKKQENGSISDLDKG